MENHELIYSVLTMAYSQWPAVGDALRSLGYIAAARAQGRVSRLERVSSGEKGLTATREPVTIGRTRPLRRTGTL